MADKPDEKQGSNYELTAEQMREIDDLTKEFIAIEKQVTALNADKNSKRKQIRALGVNLDAWRASVTRMRMDPDDRADFDRSREICDKALGVPVQADLFAEDDDDGGLPTLDS